MKKGVIAGYEFLSSNSWLGSIDIYSESEATMSKDDECVVDKISSSFTFTAGAADDHAQQRIYPQPQQHVNQDPTISETSWTDEKHSLYLKSIEEEFVKNLYEGVGHYIYSCKRRESERITTCTVSGKGFYKANGTKAWMRWNHEDIQKCTKRSRLERICIKQGLQKQDINGRANSFKSEKESRPGEGTTEIEDVSYDSSPKTQMQCFKDTSKHARGRNKEISQRYMQEDQVVP